MARTASPDHLRHPVRINPSCLCNGDATMSIVPKDELAAICAVVGCQDKPGVALRFVSELRRDNQRAHERQVELLRTWEDASLTERQELDRLRRGWGPSTPTERMARRTELIKAMHVIARAMDAVAPDDKDEEALTLEHFQTAYDQLVKGYREIIGLLQVIPALTDPDIADPAKATGAS
jgi:hypothetical protein